MENSSVYPDTQNSQQQPSSSNPQIDSTGLAQKKPLSSGADVDKKIRFWKKFSLTVGLITFFGYILVLIVANTMAHGTQFGWIIFMIFGSAWQSLVSVLFILSLVCILRVIVLSRRRKEHILKDYVVVGIGLLLIFSPYAISGVLSFFRITWNEDDSVSITLKSKDPFYISDSTSSSWVCVKGYETSNDLKSADINEKYNYIDGEKKRILFATKQYMEQISNEISCQVGEFYKQNGHYPGEDDIKKFSEEAINDDLRAGVYSVKLETGEEPNNKDFTILFDKNCTNKTNDKGNVVVLSPIYDKNEGRYCVYNDIGQIVNNLGKVKK